MQYAPRKIAYGFNPLNRAYTGEANAYLDPLASTDTEAVYTLPANAVWDSPPSTPLAEFTRYEYHDGWQIATDREALTREIDRRRAQVDARISVCDDEVLLLVEDASLEPESEQLQADLKTAKVAALAWKRYRLELARMAASVETLDVSALVWPTAPAV